MVRLLAQGAKHIGPTWALRIVEANKLGLSSFHCTGSSRAACWRNTLLYSSKPVPPCLWDFLIMSRHMSASRGPVGVMSGRQHRWESSRSISVEGLCLSSEGELPSAVCRLAVHVWHLAGNAVPCCPPAVLSSPHIGLTGSLPSAWVAMVQKLRTIVPGGWSLLPNCQHSLCSIPSPSWPWPDATTISYHISDMHPSHVP